MKKKIKKEQPVLSNFEKMIICAESTLKYYADYDYDMYYPCGDGSDCCYNDMCRCGEIKDFVIKSIRYQDLVNSLGEKLSVIEKYSLDRIGMIHEMFHPKNYSVEISGGYYGEEFEIKLNNSNLFIDSLKIVSHLSDVEKIKFVLKEEYSFLTDFLKSITQVDIVNISFDQIKVSNENHMKKIKNLEIYNNYTLPRAIVRKDGDKYVIIDGHHRVESAHKLNKKFDVIVVS